MRYIEEQLKRLPDRPGVYLMKDETGEVIYVGKAKSLRRRVRSYFRKGNHTFKTKIMVKHIADFDYIVTDTEVEAFILEANLIKKYNPKFNIRLKDDKTYPYIKVTVQEDFPRIFKTRLVKNDGNRYFGPFTDVNAIYKTIDVLKDLFSLRTCKKNLEAGKPEKRPCLNYHIGKCVGPCIGAIDRNSYRELVDRVCLFLSGKQDELINEVEKEMYQAAEKKNFEKAARFRDAVRALKNISAQQKVMSSKNINQDIIALVEEEGEACVQVLFIRNGRLIGQEYFLMEGVDEESNTDIMVSFLQQYYEQAPEIPQEIVINTHVSQTELLEDWLQQKKGKKVKILIPLKGEKKRLVEMASKNASQNLKKELIRRKYQKQRNEKALDQLVEYLVLSSKPVHIEGFDISNIQGSDPVASMVVFKDGVPSKADYRRFRIKTVSGPNDFAMMQEVVKRRYSRLLEEEGDLPDLILIDGGKGQLNAALEVLKEMNLDYLDIAGLAKREEEVFLPGQKEPVIIPRKSPALHLLQRVRDEAHRFAVSYHRKLRSRRLTHTMLDEIPGVGPKRRKALLSHFGSLGAIRKATIGQLKEVDGISNKTARVIYDYLREHTRP
ncbi:excinuclease ABC, C subunit [Halothermothrix orenii H 168]|uniref:UvrABC system protein C n=2 Tax=Halothermothrix orenii TaxID=31909 RepID=B8CYK1_HALOH|nr:excinuclease ABC, C subunit [Halothermothrix orenii H 168]